MNTQSAANTVNDRPRRRAWVLGAGIDALGWDEAVGSITRAAEAGASNTVCVCNVHSVVTANFDAEFARALDSADLATPDGAPVAWAMRQLGHAGQERIDGPGLMWKLLARAEARGLPVFFYGSSEATLARLRQRLALAFPQLQVAGMHAPPFRALTAQEDAQETQRIGRSGARLVFVGLGCPKQEKWMAAHRGRIPAVMLGVGAAFDYHAGVLQRAPAWWQRHGLEWLYRLCREPRRLFLRYAVTNTLFMLGFGRQLLQRYFVFQART